MLAYIAILVMLLVLASIAFIYNKLMKLQIRCNEGWSGIDVQLKKRAELIPALVEIVNYYTAFESSLLLSLTKLRIERLIAIKMKDQENLENEVTGTLKSLFIKVENYPELKANEKFLKLQNEISLVEKEIQLARRYYNGTVRIYNIYVDSFPFNIIARLFFFKRKAYFEIQELSSHINVSS